MWYATKETVSPRNSETLISKLRLWGNFCTIAWLLGLMAHRERAGPGEVGNAGAHLSQRQGVRNKDAFVSGITVRRF